MEEAYERKMLKYAELVEQCKSNGWKTWCFPVEVGCRGFPGNSLWRATKMLGIVGKERRDMIHEAGRRAESASLWIWNRRTDGTQISASTPNEVHPEIQPVITDAQAGTTCIVCRRAGHQTLGPECPRRLETPTENITLFKGKADALSNFYPCDLKVFGHAFKSSEHAYQYMKARYYGKMQLADEVRRQKSACAAKRLVRNLRTEVGWESERLDVMRHIIQAKLESVPEYRHQLVNARRVIAECVPGDNYWSSGLSKDLTVWCREENWPGKNIMGKLHMKLREDIIDKIDVDL